MRDDEKFLARWSRRKVEEVDKKDVEKAPNAAEPESAAVSEEQKNQEFPDVRKDEKKEPLFDLTKLPPIDSIVASTDIRPFLAPGVPPELTRAALRRAWTTDPAIRDFIGISENSWDFTKPDSMPGFGPLLMTDSLRKMVTEMFAHIGQTEEEAAKEMAEKKKAVETREAASVPTDSSEMAIPKKDSESEVAELGSLEKKNILPVGNFTTHQVTLDEHIASQHTSESEKANDPSPRRGHGGALPR
jgi:hypothetical protein